MMFKGIYAQYIIDYLNFQRSLGYKLRDREYVYTIFDRLTIERNEKNIGISRELSDEWCQRRPNETEGTQYIRIVTINLFSRHLRNLGYKSHLPTIPKHRYSFSPYIYTMNEVVSILDAADSYASEKLQNSSYRFIPILFRLLYCTGMRITEALTLVKSDVDLQKQLITIRCSKNGTERVIPMSDSITSVVAQYDMENNNEKRELFFEQNGKKGYSKSCISEHFRHILFRAGITYKGKYYGPRVHDLRHTFACHALDKLEKLGYDMYSSLPILSTYLGHRTLEGTEKYLRLTPMLYSEFMHKQETFCSNIFPEPINE